MSKQDGSTRQTTDGDVDDSRTPFLHIDMDAFFASVEELDDPTLRGKPVIVGGTSARGVVSTANYVARRFGVHSAMPMGAALRRCPTAIVRSPRFSRYSEISRTVFDILADFTPLVRPLSIDEAFCDVSGATALFGSPRIIAEKIRERIQSETGLTASIGVASSMFVAKVAGSQAKPDGLLVVPDNRTVTFLAPLSISALWGVGPVTAQRLERFGIRIVGDIQREPVESLASIVGERSAAHLRHLAFGIDERQIDAETLDKSIGRSNTFPVDLEDPDTMRREIIRMAHDVTARARRHKLSAHTVAVTVRFADWTTLSRSHSQVEPTAATRTVANSALSLFETIERHGQRVRLLGVRLENLVGAGANDYLWNDDADGHEIDAVVDAVHDRFGKNVVTPASLLRRPTAPPQ